MICIKYPITQAKIAPVIGAQLPVVSHTLCTISHAKYEIPVKKIPPHPICDGEGLRKKACLLHLAQALLYLIKSGVQSVLSVRNTLLRSQGNTQAIQSVHTLLLLSQHLQVTLTGI